MSNEITEIKGRVIEGMESFMNHYIEDGDEPPYTNENIKECEKILSVFINNISSLSDNEEMDIITSSVKDTILKLNALNEKCDYNIIETDQREDICELINAVITSKGHTVEEDITEEWREW